MTEKVVILAGGLGTRLSEETVIKPKPMVEIGGYPILWHIMNIYSTYHFNEFILALGYKGDVIKEYFLNYYNFQSDLTIQLKTGNVVASKKCYRDWIVHLIDTGINSLTGGRLYAIRDRLNHETFMLTYGDGVANVNISELLAFHKSHGKIATVTAVRPSARFGNMVFDGNKVVEFKEKQQTGEGWINGGFFVFEPKIFDYLNEKEQTVLEGHPLEQLAREGQLMAYQHHDFWACMDTVRDKEHLETMWKQNNAPWNIWS